MSWSQLGQAFLARLQADPVMSLVLFGILFISIYLLIALMTRLGDIRPGVQSLILSACIHLLMLTFLGAVAVRQMPRKPATAETIEVPIREVLVEERNLDPSSTTGEHPLREQLNPAKQQELVRLEEPRPEGSTAPSPQRSVQTTQSAPLPSPEIHKPDIVENSPPVKSVSSSPLRKAQGTLQNEQETARTQTVPPPAPRISTRTESPQRPPQTQGATREKSSTTTQSIPVASAIPTPETDPPPESPARRPLNQVPLASTPTPSKQPLIAEDPGPTHPPVKSQPNNNTPVATGSTPSNGTPAQMTGIERTRPLDGAARSTPMASPVSRSLSNGASGSGGSRRELGPLTTQTPASKSNPLRNRELPQRSERAITLGATADSEQAVELALAWFAAHQNPEGYWDADAFNRHCPAGDQCRGVSGQGTPQQGEQTDRQQRAFDPEALQQAGVHADTGLTGLILLAFVGAGYTQESGQYADQLDRAQRWLIRQQQANGFLGGAALRYDKMYCHGMATFALGESCAMTRDPQHAQPLRAALRKSIQYIIDVQNAEDGGWRYLPGQRGDMSMFGWQLMALRSAELAGIPTPQETTANMRRFLENHAQGTHGGLAGYLKEERAKPSMTAEFLFSRQILGLARKDPATLEAVDYVMRHLPRESEPDLYFWYYGTLALRNHGGAEWQTWNSALRDALLHTQRKKGHAAGSWDPNDAWGTYGGRLYATAICTLCLEVYYRYLPLSPVDGTNQPK